MRAEIHHVTIELAVICEPGEEPECMNLEYLVNNQQVIDVRSVRLLGPDEQPSQKEDGTESKSWAWQK